VQSFSRFGVSTVYEAAGRRGLIDAPFIPILPDSRAAGPARTVLCGQDDHLMVHAVMEQIEPGEILVLTMPEPRPVALMGDLMVFQARRRQVAGILVDAAVRDVPELRQLGVPIWTRYISARAAGKAIVGSIGAPVTVGGVQIRQGDIVVLDADGGVVVPAETAKAVLEACVARDARDASILRQLEAGALTYDLHGLRKLVETTPPEK
jgi:4-hydroxy-4-methyl-2-oxoglutarate aldolase